MEVHQLPPRYLDETYRGEGGRMGHGALWVSAIFSRMEWRIYLLKGSTLSMESAGSFQKHFTRLWSAYVTSERQVYLRWPQSKYYIVFCASTFVWMGIFESTLNAFMINFQV